MLFGQRDWQAGMQQAIADERRDLDKIRRDLDRATDPDDIEELYYALRKQEAYIQGLQAHVEWRTRGTRLGQLTDRARRQSADLYHRHQAAARDGRRMEAIRILRRYLVATQRYHDLNRRTDAYRADGRDD